MTAQYSEELILNGEKKALHSTPELPNDESKVQLLEKGGFINTACWRGYVGTWEIKNKKLFLNEISGKFKIKGSKPLFADWFTGTLIIPNGELLKYIHGGFGGKHAEEELITVVNGRVIKIEYKNNKKTINLNLKKKINQLVVGAINDSNNVITCSNTFAQEQLLIMIQFEFDDLLEKHLGKLILQLHNSELPISLNVSKAEKKLSNDNEFSSLTISLEGEWAKEICDFLGIIPVDSYEKLPCLKKHWISFGEYEYKSITPPKVYFGDDINF